MAEPLAPRSRPQLRVLTGGAPEAEPSYSDPELFECIARGEERAAASLYRRLLSDVELSLLAVLERRDARHDELVQRSFERMIARISRRRYAEACSLSTWARAVSARVALDVLRAEQRRQRRSARTRKLRTPRLSAVSSGAAASEPPAASAPSFSTAAAGASGERSNFLSRGSNCLRESMSRLSSAQAELVVLHDLLGLPVAEIATLGRLSLAATQTRLMRAHKELTLALLAEGWLAELPRPAPPARSSRPSQPARGRVTPVPGKAADLEDLFLAWRSQASEHHRPSSIGRGGSRAVVRALSVVARRRRRARGLNTLGLAAVALLTLLGVGFGVWFAQQRLSGEAERAAAAQPHVLLGGVLGDVTVSDREGRIAHGFASLGEGYTLRTDDGSARLGFSSGAAVAVAHHSRLVLLSAQDTEVLYLGNGTAEIDLPDLALGGSFAVETPDTHVTSRAAQFVVGVESDGGPPTTRVSVRSGHVSLRAGAQRVELDAGQSWPAVTPAGISPAVTPASASAAAERGSAVPPSATPATSGSPSGGTPELSLPELAPRAAPVDSAEK